MMRDDRNVMDKFADAVIGLIKWIADLIAGFFRAYLKS